VEGVARQGEGFYLHCTHIGLARLERRL
jgi:hypothetical protein